METPETLTPVESAAATEELKAHAAPVISFDDLEVRDTVALVPVTLVTGKQVQVPVRRLTGKEAVAYFKAANDAKDADELNILKLRRFLAHPTDHKKQLFADVQVIEIIEKREAGHLAALLAAIHTENPYVKNG